MDHPMPTVALTGRTVSYIQAGRGPGAPLLLVHGFTGSKEDFALVLDELGNDRKVVAVDLPGHGGSQAPPDPAGYGLSASAEWVLRAAAALDLGAHHLLGHSLGGLVVQRVAAAAGQRLRSLVLMDTGLGALRDEVADLVARVAVAAREHGMQAAWEERCRLNQRRAVRYEPPHGREDFVRRRFLALDPAAVVAGAHSLIEAAPLDAFLRRIRIPVLVIHGEHDDAWTPVEQQLLARTVRGAELAVVRASRHSPQLENPVEWLAAVRDFLRRAEGDERSKGLL